MKSNQGIVKHIEAYEGTPWMYQKLFFSIFK